MTRRHVLTVLATIAMATAQSGSKAVVVNLDSADWSHDKDSESMMIRMDQATGGMDLLVRFPAGHVIPAHFHDSNERVIVVEGELTQSGSVIKTGGFAFLPAHEIQRLSCSSKTRCTFYLCWDGKPDSHPAR